MGGKASVAVVGSGPVGTAIAYYCASRGIDVTVFEKGPSTVAFPFVDQFVRTQALVSPRTAIPDDLQNMEQVGDYKAKLNRERVMVVGGAGTVWTAQTPRFMPSDFATRSRFGYGVDWPISYDDLEPSVCAAEAFLGISGTDADNPFAPPRSKPFPLPPFELGYYERILADRAKAAGIVIHTTPQARARHAYDGRNGCLNFGLCVTCPTGARYAPNFHLQLAVASGHCAIRSNTSVRRVMVERGRATGLVVRANDSARDEEVPASVVVIAGGTFESTRLLMLSSNGSEAGLGNAGGQLGQHFILKHSYRAHLHFKTKVYAQRLPFGAQSQQFVDSDTRGKHGGLRLNLSAQDSFHELDPDIPAAAEQPPEKPGDPRPRPDELLQDIRLRPNCMRAAMLCESIPMPENRLALSERKDRFGDPFIRATMKDSEFDHATYEYALSVIHRVSAALEATEYDVAPAGRWVTAHHHYGGTRMGTSVADSVVDAFGRVHGVTGVFVLGGSTFPSQSCNNPTLTMVALALRSADLVVQGAEGVR